jgi:beta-glucanase (GH16 family)
MNKGVVNVANRKLLINEDFSAWVPDPGNGSAQWDWYTQPLTVDPWGGPWGSPWDNPSPFAVVPRSGGGNALRITARQTAAGAWSSGMLCSVSADGTAGMFLPPYCYAEASVELPGIAGAEPAFWLNTVVPPGFIGGTLEIDIIEAPNDQLVLGPAVAQPFFQSTVHQWGIQVPTQTLTQPMVPSAALTTGFHLYGVEVDPDCITFYLDRQAYWRLPRPPVFPLPFALMIGLAIGGQGYPPPAATVSSVVMTIGSIQVWR